jgi:hypothetical protein
VKTCATDEPSDGRCVNASQTFFGISEGSIIQAHNSMRRVSAGCTRSVTMYWSTHLWPMTLSTISGVQTWGRIPSKHRRAWYGRRS